MARLLASVALSALLLVSSAQAAVLAAFAPQGCDAGACGCADEEPAGPAFDRDCCCSIESQEAPESEPTPSYVEESSTSAPAPAPDAVATPFSTVPDAGRDALLRANPPRAPPVTLLRLYGVLRC